MNTHLSLLLFAALFCVGIAAQTIPTGVVYNQFTSQYITAVGKTSTNKNIVLKDVYNNPVYQDRVYNVTNLPLEVFQAAYVSLYNADKLETTTSYFTLNFIQPMTVWIAFDSRATSIPAWMTNMNFIDTGLVVTRTDDVGTLNLKLYHSSIPRASVTLGAPNAAGSSGSNSMYIPYFTLATFSCIAESFSDNFFHDDLSDGFMYGPWIKFEYSGQNEWFSNSKDHTMYSTAGHQVAVTAREYSSSSFTLQTRASRWFSNGEDTSTSFFFGATQEIDTFFPQDFIQVYQLRWNLNSNTLVFRYTNTDGSFTNLGSKSFAQASTAFNSIKIEKTLQSIKVWVSAANSYALPSTPTFTINAGYNDPFYFPVGRFGWERYNSAQENYVTIRATVDYVQMNGNNCNSQGILHKN